MTQPPQPKPQPRPPSPSEIERLQPGANPPRDADPAPNDAALPGSQNEDLRGARRDRKPRGAST